MVVAEPCEYAFCSRRVHCRKSRLIRGSIRAITRAALVVSCVESVQNEVPDFRAKNHNVVYVVSRFGEDLLFQVTRIVVNYAIYLGARLRDCCK